MIFIRKIGNVNPSKTGLFEGSLTQCSEATIQRCSSCSENMQQIYRRTSMQSNFIETALRYGCSPVNLLHIFRTLSPKNTAGWLLIIQYNFMQLLNNLLEVTQS